MSVFVVLCCVQAIVTQAQPLDHKPTLNILGLLPYYQRSSGWEIGYRIIPAVQIAVDDVNKDSSILPDYNLTMIMENGGCDQKTIVATSVGTALLSENIVGIVGAPCTASTIVMSNIVNNAGINQVSYGSELADVSDTTLYPYFFRTTISLAHAADGFSKLLEYFNRRSIIIVSQSGTWQKVASFFRKNYQRYKGNNNKIAHESVLTASDNDNDLDSNLKKIRTSNNHVIVTFLEPGNASALMCRAYKMRMTSPNYLWIHHLTTGEWEWWLNGDYFKSCTKDEMQRAHQGSMIHRLTLNTTNETRYETFINEYTTRLAAYLTDLKVPYNSINCSDRSLPCVTNIVHGQYSRTAYDAVWVLAKALHRAEEKLKQEYNQTLGDFQRGINHFSELIHDSLRDTKFPGLSGDIDYQHGGNQTLDKNTRATKSAFFQIGATETVRVAEYDSTLSEEHQLDPTDKLSYINRSIPKDSDGNYTKLFHPEVGYVCLTLNILFLVMIIVLGILNNRFVDHQPFKGSDGTLTNFQIGAVLMLTTGSLITSVFASADIDNAVAFGVAVNVSTWMTEVGLILFLALAASKSYRFYSIFVNYLRSRHALNVRSILAFALIVMGVAIIYEFVITIISPILRSPNRRCEILEGVIIHCYYYSSDLTHRYASYFIIMPATMMSIFLFILGTHGWTIKDPRFYDIHNNAMLSVGLIFYCILGAVAIPVPTMPLISWPFMHALSTTALCGFFLQIFFICPFLWRFYTLHQRNTGTRCHCNIEVPVLIANRFARLR